MLKTTHFVCSHCGAARPLHERILVGDDAICGACVLNYTCICEDCGARIWNSDRVYDSHITLCEHCFERSYTRCIDCDRIVHNSDAYFDEADAPYCGNCWNEKQKHTAIHEYHYKPEPIFYGDGIRYLGVELEIDCGGKDCHSARRILNIANAAAEHLYIKSDGSLDDGMELVTHPMTLDYHRKQMPWEAVLSEARALGYLSHKAQTCGLHIHISREAFGETRIQQECTIARMLYFVEKFWTELLRFSRRTESQINRWAARYGMKLSPQEVLDCAKDHHMGRYAAVNLTNWRTIEIRIFRGTLKWNTLLATLQMVHAICNVAVFMSDDELQALSWHGFLDRIHDPELIQYLKERNLYKNEPVFCEEED